MQKMKFGRTISGKLTNALTVLITVSLLIFTVIILTNSNIKLSNAEETKIQFNANTYADKDLYMMSGSEEGLPADFDATTRTWYTDAVSVVTAADDVIKVIGTGNAAKIKNYASYSKLFLLSAI